MDLDHKDREDKVTEVSYMLRHKYSKDKILTEIAKCEVVCACCHRLRHYYKTHRNPITKIF